MKKFFTVFLALTAVASATPPAPWKIIDRAAALQTLVRAEREFSKTSVAKGTRAAFLAFLAADGILFRPGPVNGRKFLSERPDRPGVLTWEPSYADISRAGDLGYTTGPWEFRPKSMDEKPVGHGQYMTIWRKEQDGSWKFVLDMGASHAAPTSAPPSLSFASDFRQNTERDKMSVDTPSVEKSILKLEREFSKTAATDAGRAFDAYAADDIRVLRNDMPPVTGSEAARKVLSANTMSWEPVAAHASRSGDFAYTYGTYERKPTSAEANSAGERGHYVHIWKKKTDGKWRVVLDLLNPLPAN